MRIGDVNQSNYKQFLAMLGVKSNKTLDKLMGADQKPEEARPLSKKEYEAKLMKMGYISEEGMLIMEGEDISQYNRIVPVSDEVRNKIIDTVRRQFLENGNGMSKSGGVDGEELGAIGKEYRKNIPPSERLAVSWTLSQIQTNEIQRLTDYIKSKNPSWKPGQAFDKNILINSDFGTKSVDIKA